MSNSELPRAGVKICQRTGAVMHSRAASVDGVRSTISSVKLDWHKFQRNDEINAAIPGRDFSRQVDAMFAVDLAVSNAIGRGRWAQWSLLPDSRSGQRDSPNTGNRPRH